MKKIKLDYFRDNGKKNILEGFWGTIGWINVIQSVYRYCIKCVCVCIYIYTHAHTQQYLVVTISLGGFVADQIRYNLDSVQYLW